MQRRPSEAEPAKQRFGLAARLRSFRYAVNGLRLLLRHEHNSRVHLGAAIMVIALGSIRRVTACEWRWLILAILLVWTAEAFNSAIEWLCDLVSPGFHPLVKRIKDVAAGAVLMSSIGAAAIGVTVFWPYRFAAVHVISGRS